MRDIYNTIAKSFDKTRYAMWPCVQDFYKANSHGYCIDVGCGNGKNVVKNDSHWYELCDLCDAFVEMCSEKHPNSGVCHANGLHLPYRAGVFDSAMSIAVVHHLNSIELRKRFVYELVRVVKPGGKGLITTWARTDDEPQDRNVPWRDCTTNTTIQRYYHMFDPGELEELFDGTGCTLSSKYERHNHVVEFTTRV